MSPFVYKRSRIVLFKLRILFAWPFFCLKKSRVPFSCRVGANVTLYGSDIGRYCYIGPGCILNNVEMGNYCSLAPHVQIGGMEHAWWCGSTSPFLSNRHIDNLKTRIGADVWIGANAVVRQSVSVERGSVVGAGAVVLNDVPPYSIVVGQPARVLKRRFSDEIIEQLENSRFWELEPKEAKRKLDDIPFPSKPEWLMGMQIAEK